MALDGYLDLCTPSVISGWAWDSDQPESRITVEILVDGNPLAQVIAQDYREDLEKQGIGDGNYGYWYSPRAPIDPDGQSISVQVLGTNVHLERSRPAKVAGGGRVALNCPPIEVELDADAAELQAMYEHINSTWSQLSRTEPYWSVLTHSNFRTDVFYQHKAEFFQSSKSVIADFVAFTLRSGVYLSREQTCFELGCGVGRLTTGLSPMFSRVIAADISAGHLQIAETVLAENGVNNVSLCQLKTMVDFDNIGPFDVFFSVIVFQHNPPPIMAAMLRKILTQLNDVGIAYFQMPTYSKGYSFRVEKYLSSLKERRYIEHHVLPQRAVIDIIYDCGCKLLEIREDSWTGNVNDVSNTFLVQKTPINR